MGLAKEFAFAEKEFTVFSSHHLKIGPCLPDSVRGYEPNFDKRQLSDLNGFHID